MAALLFLTLSLVCGYALVRSLPLRLSWGEQLGGTVGVGILIASWIVLLLSWALPYRISLPLADLALLLVGAGVLFFRRRQMPPVQLLPIRHELALLGFAALVTLAAVPLFASHMMRIGPDGWYSAGASWGDLGLHMTLVSFFAYQEHFSWQFPLLYQAKLTYPFLIDLFSGVLYRGGWSMQASLIVPGILLTFALAQLFLALSYRLFARPASAVLGLSLFLLSGSVGGAWYAYKDWQGSGQGLAYFLLHLPREYNQQAAWGLQAANLAVNLLLPQRSFLLGLPLFCLVFILLLEARREAPERQWPLLLAASLLTGLLPLAHLHTFLAAALFLGCLCAEQLVRRGRSAWPWLAGLGIALLLAIPQGLWQLFANPHGQVGHFYFGWMRQPGQGWFSFWWVNLGLELPLLLLPFLRRSWRFLYLPFLLLFLVLNVYILQPNDYDNSKLLLFVTLGFSLFAADLLASWASQGWAGGGVVALVVLSLVLSSCLAIAQEQEVSYLFLGNGDLAFARDFRAVVPPTSLVLTSHRHNHPVPTLTGRPIVLGYDGWLWSYGLEYGPVYQDVNRIYAGDQRSDQLLAQYGVNYVVVGPSELSDNQASLAYFQGRYPRVLDEYGYQVFKIK